MAENLAWVAAFSSYPHPPRLKGIVSQDECFLGVQRIKSVLFVRALKVFTIFGGLFEEDIK
jgi:hypothetical protein